MNNRDLRHHPPLWTWFVSSLASAFIVGLLYLFIKDVDYQFPEFDRYNSERIAQFLEEEAAVKIIVAGDSRVRYGIDPKIFASAVENKLGSKTVAMILSVNRGGWNRLRPSLTQAQARHPGLVVLVDDNMFAKEWTWLHDLRQRWDYAVWSVFGPQYWRFDGDQETQAETQTDLRCEGWLFTKETPAARNKRVSQYVSLKPVGRNARDVETFINSLRGFETRVGTVYVPPQPGGEPMVWKRPTDELSVAVGFSPDPDMYCDPVHLNEAGRRDFSQKLAQSFVEWFQ